MIRRHSHLEIVIVEMMFVIVIRLIIPMEVTLVGIVIAVRELHN